MNPRQTIGLVGLLIALAIYFIPTFVANRRHLRNIVAIGALNLLAGWTLIGWVGALVWAFTHNTRDQDEPGSAVPSEPERRACPQCAEMILPAAKKCRFCGAEL